VAAEIEADVMVIGSGIAGALAAFAAATQGKRVVILEQGPALSDACASEISRHYTFYGVKSLPHVAVIRTGADGTVSRLLPTVVGGLANFYQGVSLRMRQAEFQRWPIEYAQIEPYYSHAEELLGVAGMVGNDPYEPPRSRPYPYALPEPTAAGRRMIDAAHRMGVRAFQHPLAIRFDSGCQRCFYCNQVPCPVSVKFSPARFLAQHAGWNVAVYPEHQVRQIVFREHGTAKRVEHIVVHAQRGSQPLQGRAHTYLLCAGALQTPALMLRSGLGEHNPLIGRYLMTHALGEIWGFFADHISGRQEFDKWVTITDWYFDTQGCVRGVIQQEQLTPLARLLTNVPHGLRFLTRQVYLNALKLLVIAEDEPQPANRVEPASHRQLRIHHTLSAADKARRLFLVQRGKEILRRMGAMLRIGINESSIFHSCGTCRMGRDPSTSVTDPGGRVWGFDNLFVADASLMPTSSGVNPSLTIAALALLVADQL
jgi:choline dehydrogenase-like flavoprotein